MTLIDQHTAGSIASKNIISIAPEASVAEALALMSSRRISSVLVVMHRTAVGIFTERDIVLAANKVLGYPDLLIREVMSSPVLSVDGRIPALEAFRLMRENGIRHLVVNDPDYDIEGILTQTDLINKLPAASFPLDCTLAGLMSTPVKTVTREVSARRALAEMARHSVSCVVVVEEGKPVGIFSERDVARLFAGSEDLWSSPIEKVMSCSLETVPATLTLAEAVERMRKRMIRRLIVTDQGGMLAGLITQSDLNRVFGKQTSSVPEPQTLPA